jgi:phosphatidylserine/phosphatidylglycerophosphate/cardiolipin synthase-like enzyme
MKTTLVAYANSDDALVLWSADALDDNLEGFSIQRQLKRVSAAQQTSWIDNYAPPGIKAYQNGQSVPSDQRPFRAFRWTDHSVRRGDKVRYRVVPFLAGTTAPSLGLASNWSRWLTLGPPANATYQAFFNRGFVISQFMSRYLDENYPTLDRLAALREFKTDITTQLENKIRQFLSGEIRTALLTLLDEANTNGHEIYAALFELSDPELVTHLSKLGKRAHVVLANGSIQVKTDPKTHKAETQAAARKRDENKDEREQISDAGVDVEPTNRFVAPKPLAHNKFLVVVDKNGNPLKAWTGSTNWTSTGLCTQLNNALLIDDPEVAAAYLAQWHQLRNAGSNHPSKLAKENSTPTEFGGTARKRIRSSVHFTRAQDKVDLTALGDIVRSARQGVLFLMFMPGPSGVLKDVLALQKAKPNLLVRGVVSTLPNGRQDEKSGPTTAVTVTLHGAPNPALAGPRTYDVVQPEGKNHPSAWWAAETTRSQFLSAIGFAIIHSKILLIDPFSDDPTIVTGSHNFSGAASTSNDENFIVIKGDTALAEAYAVNIDSAWRHYASRAGNPYHGITGIDYLKAILDDQRREEPFWCLS